MMPPQFQNLDKEVQQHERELTSLISRRPHLSHFLEGFETRQNFISKSPYQSTLRALPSKEVYGRNRHFA